MADRGTSASPRRATMLAVRGALAVVLGLSTGGLSILAVLFPRVTANVLVLLFGTYMLLDGLLALVNGLRSPTGRGPWQIVQGVIGLCVGVVVVSQRSIGPLLFYLIVFWAVAIGVLDLLMAQEIRQPGQGRLRLAGIASILFGVIVLAAWPGAGVMLFLWLLAAYALLVGIVRIVAALRLQSS